MFAATDRGPRRLTASARRPTPREPSILGLTALLLLQHARTSARLDGEGNIVLLDRQDRSRWDRSMIAEGVALLDAGMRIGRSDPYLGQAAIAALHAQARRAEDTDWPRIDLLYATLEARWPSPVVTLNRAVAVARSRGAAAALERIPCSTPRCGSAEAR